MPKRTLVILMLVIAIVISFGIAEIIVFSRGGSLGGPIRIENFTLCQTDNTDGTLRPLTSSILTPTTVVHACGYLDVSLLFPGELCLYYQLERHNKIVFRPDSYYCMPYRSQYFSFPVTTTELLTPGTYEIYSYPTILRERPASVYFEVRPNSK